MYILGAIYPKVDNLQGRTGPVSRGKWKRGLFIRIMIHKYMRGSGIYRKPYSYATV